MEAPRLVASDVDGTLLDPYERVPARAGAAIERLVAAGVGFVLVTGRPPRWIPPVVALLPVTRLAVCANGGVLYDAVEDRVLWARTFDPDTVAWTLWSAVHGLAALWAGGTIRSVSGVAEPAEHGGAVTALLLSALRGPSPDPVRP